MGNIAVNRTETVRVRAGQVLAVTTAAGTTATVVHKNRVEGGVDNASYSMAASQTKLFGPFVEDETFKLSCAGIAQAAVTYSTAKVSADDTTAIETLLGVQAAQPAAGSVLLNVERVGFLYRLTFTLNAARVTITDAGGSGSHGSLKLFDFVEQALNHVGCRQNYTAFAEGAALTGAAGDAVFDIGVGTVAKAAPADGALGGATDDDIGGEIAVTLSEGTGVGTLVTPGPTAVNGTETAGSINLNISGSAATIDATSHLDVTGTITCLVALLGDD